MAHEKQTPPKLNYIALLKQGSEGCDYTIACGTAVVMLEATTPEGALAECKELLSQYRGERGLASMHIFETTRSLRVPIDQFYMEMEDKARAATEANEEAAARAQYAQLQARFGGS